MKKWILILGGIIFSLTLAFAATTGPKEVPSIAAEPSNTNASPKDISPLMPQTVATEIESEPQIETPSVLPPETPIPVTVVKPHGIFTSSGATQSTVINHPAVQGALVRGLWKEIEIAPGVFDFTRLDAQINALKKAGKSYSLAINAGGLGSPDWLTSELEAAYLDYKFRNQFAYKLPLFWDETVQERLHKLALALSQQYGDDPNLHLVYIPQMTANGLEGHLQGISLNDLERAGYTDQKWIEAAISVSRHFAEAFKHKALAFEVHEINNGAAVPAQILNTLWEDPQLEQRVGAGVWWLSGKTNYQSQLLDVLATYPGDIYAQVIGKSADTQRFLENDYRTVFTQAKTLNIRYIEPWEYEFKTGPNGANGIWDELFTDFNTWAEATKL